jgi:hypothetical protein
MALTTNPHLALRLKKEYNCTHTPPLGLHSMLKGELYLHIPSRNTIALIVVKLRVGLARNCGPIAPSVHIGSGINPAAYSMDIASYTPPTPIPSTAHAA